MVPCGGDFLGSTVNEHGEQQERRWLAVARRSGTARGDPRLTVSGAVIPIRPDRRRLLLVATGRRAAQPPRSRPTTGWCWSFVLGIPDDDFGDVEHLVRILVVAGGGGLAIWIASLRDAPGAGESARPSSPRRARGSTRRSTTRRRPRR